MSWSSSFLVLLGVLKAFSTWIAVCFSRFGKISPIILLNMFYIPLAYTSSPSMPKIPKFGLLMLSQQLCMFHLYFFNCSSLSLSDYSNT
jgi:hypothetical protein